MPVVRDWTSSPQVLRVARDRHQGGRLDSGELPLHPERRHSTDDRDRGSPRPSPLIRPGTHDRNNCLRLVGVRGSGQVARRLLLARNIRPWRWTATAESKIGRRMAFALLELISQIRLGFVSGHDFHRPLKKPARRIVRVELAFTGVVEASVQGPFVFVNPGRL